MIPINKKRVCKQKMTERAENVPENLTGIHRGKVKRMKRQKLQNGG